MKYYIVEDSIYDYITRGYKDFDESTDVLVTEEEVSDYDYKAMLVLPGRTLFFVDPDISHEHMYRDELYIERTDEGW